MTVGKKIKTIDDKIEQNRVNRTWQEKNAKISGLSSGNIGMFEFLTGKDLLTEKELLEKASPVKRFEY